MTLEDLKNHYLLPLSQSQSSQIPITYEALLQSYQTCLPHATSKPLLSALKKIHSTTLAQYEQAARGEVVAKKVYWVGRAKAGGIEEERAVEGEKGRSVYLWVDILSLRSNV